MERMHIKPVKAWMEGRCCIQYTDPLTGRILEEIRGGNHVFESQLNGLGCINNVMPADLLLTTGGFLPTDGEVPFLPGEPIGWGRIGEGTQGAYRGQYRSADSYYDKRTTSKITNKYVYDFLPTQALGGPVNWVGLTGHFGKGGSVSCLKYPFANSMGPNNQNTITDCSDAAKTYIRKTSNAITVYRASVITAGSFSSKELSALLGPFYTISNYYFAAEAGGKDFFVIVNGRKTSGDSTHLYVYRVDYDFTQVKGSWEIQESYSNTPEYGFFDEGKIYLYYKNFGDDHLSRMSWDVIDLDALSVSYFNSETLGINVFRLGEYEIFRYGNSIWYQVYYNNYGLAGNIYSGKFAYIGLFYDAGKHLSMPCIPPSIQTLSSDIYIMFSSMVPQLNGQFCYGYNKGYAPEVNFAFTRYQVPDGVPARPEGSGMTVTYELDITI